jgi:hypothetical protein
VNPSPKQIEHARELIIEAEQTGLNHVHGGGRLLEVIRPDVVASHVAAFQWTFGISAVIALLGAFFSLVLVRKTDRVKVGVFSRRSRWITASSGRSSALTRRPPPRPGESATG